MFDPKIDNSYCNSQGEFVDVYAELRLPDGPESSKDAITQAYRNFVRACHPDVCKDKKLAEAMTTFANRARAVLEMERAPYNEKWRQERGRKKAATKRTWTDSSSKSWTIPPSVERAVGCIIVPLIGVGAVAVGLTALYNWKGSDWLEAMQARPRIAVEPPTLSESRAPVELTTPEVTDSVPLPQAQLEPLLVPTTSPEPETPSTEPHELNWNLWRLLPVKTDFKAPISDFQSAWFEVDASKVSQLVGNTRIKSGTDKEQDGEIIKHRACAAFTISCQNGLMRGYSQYWLQNACPEFSNIEGGNSSGYPELFLTSTWNGTVRSHPGNLSNIPAYPNISPHPYIVCSEKSDSEEITGYRTFLSLGIVK